MDIMKLQLKWTCRVEYLGVGFYRSLASRYKKDEELAQVLTKFSRDEHRHGILFQKAYEEEYGKTLMTSPWIWAGRAGAMLQILLPLKLKLRILSGIEAGAIKIMNKELKEESENRYRAILSKIKADEEAHAGYFQIRYPEKTV